MMILNISSSLIFLLSVVSDLNWKSWTSCHQTSSFKENFVVEASPVGHVGACDRRSVVCRERRRRHTPACIKLTGHLARERYHGYHPACVCVFSDPFRSFVEQEVKFRSWLCTWREKCRGVVSLCPSATRSRWFNNQTKCSPDKMTPWWSETQI